MPPSALADALDSAHAIGALALERAGDSEERGCLDDDVVAAMRERRVLERVAAGGPRRPRSHDPGGRRGREDALDL